jgi:hypothetical protein
MSLFKMLLCGAGLLVFLWIRDFGASSDSPPPADASPVPTQPPGAPQASEAQVRQITEGKPVITRIEFRNKLVTVKTGWNGPVYEVQDKAGNVLAAELSEQELQACEPELYRLIQTAVGGSTAKDAGVLDARVSLSAAGKVADAPSARSR